MSQEEKGQAMAKPSITNHHLPESFCGSMKISKDVPSQSVIAIKDMFGDVEISGPVLENCNTKEFYSDLIRGHLKPQRVVRGRVTCLLTVTPAITVTISNLTSFPLQTHSLALAGGHGLCSKLFIYFSKIRVIWKF
jgi:hypothetical protein